MEMVLEPQLGGRLWVISILLSPILDTCFLLWNPIPWTRNWVLCLFRNFVLFLAQWIVFKVRLLRSFLESSLLLSLLAPDRTPVALMNFSLFIVLSGWESLS